MERYRMNYCQNWWKVPESKVRKHRTELNVTEKIKCYRQNVKEADMQVV